MERWGIVVLLAAAAAIGGGGCTDDPSATDGEGASDPTGSAAEVADASSGDTSSSGVEPSEATTGGEEEPSGPAGSGGGGAGAGGADGCGEVTFEGTCEDEVLSWCEAGEALTHDCAEDGLVCGFGDPAIGFDCIPAGGGFGYPVGDRTTWPAGGWVVTQVLGHFLDVHGLEAGDFHGGHLAQDIALTEEETADATVFSIGDGEVLYAGSNASSYVNVVLIRHEVPGEGVVCSFYGHLGSVTVTAGQEVNRGDPIATVLDWNAHFGWPNSHLHYVVLDEDLCLASDAAGGALVCGYDETSASMGIEALEDEPLTYTSIGDPCGDHAYPNAFLSPSQFIEARHF